jgi:hypothetical protein
MFFNSLYSEIDTVSEEFALEMSSRKDLTFRKEAIRCMKINEVLSLDNFDFLNIDIEGLDEEVVSSIDFSKIYKPRIICFEKQNSFVDSNSSAIMNLKKNGYRHLFTSGPSMGYYLNEVVEK